MSRPRKTEAQIQATRNQILDITYEILQEEGPLALTSRAIAERMGVAHMSLFYTYFKNQAAILSALLERELGKLRQQQRAIELRAETEDIALVVEDSLKFLIKYSKDNPNLYYMAWVMPEAGGETLEQNRQRMLTTITQLARLLKKGMDQGRFKPRDPLLAATVILGMVNTPQILYHSGRLVNLDLRDRMAQEMLTISMDYLTQ